MTDVSVSGDTAVLTLAQPVPGHASSASVVYEAPSANPLRGASDSPNSGTVESFAEWRMTVADAGHGAGVLIGVGARDEALDRLQRADGRELGAGGERLHGEGGAGRPDADHQGHGHGAGRNVDAA